MAGSVLDFLQAGVPTPVATGSDTSTNAPSWLQGYIFNTLGAANALAQQPFQQFPGPTVAAPSTPTTGAWNLASSNVGNWQPDITQATDVTKASGQPINPSDISTFLNPYQSYITGALNRNLNENLLPSIQDRFVGAGQSRSPQEQELTSRALRDTQTSVGEAMAGGYQGALNSLLQQRQQQQAAGAQLGQLGSTVSRLGGFDVGELAASGQAQDQFAQQNLNSAMSQFQQQQQWPYQQVGFLSDVVHSLPVSAAGTTSQTASSSYLNPNYMPASPLNAFLSGALNTSAAGYRRGGRIHPIGALAGYSPRRRAA